MNIDYIFGTTWLKTGEVEILKTKSSSHTNLSGFHSIERIYPDQIIIDDFHVVTKIDSKEDPEGNCYDWYHIDSHYRMKDKTKPIVTKINKIEVDLEDAIIENEVTNNERLIEIEDALIELDEQINGGADNG